MSFNRRNWMGGPRERWPMYVNVLGLFGTWVLLVIGLSILALWLSPWIWIAVVAAFFGGSVGLISVYRARWKVGQGTPTDRN